MEPADLNSPEDKSLDGWLRATNQPAIPDDGFTARVLAQLPPSAHHTSAARYRATRATAMIVGATAGIVLAWTKGVLTESAIDELARAGSRLADPAMALALVAVAAVLLYLYVPRLRRLWA